MDAGRRRRIIRRTASRLRPLSSTSSRIRTWRPASGRGAARQAGLTADFIGFDIGDEFVVGYGMDFNHYYRNLPDVVTLKPEALG